MDQAGHITLCLKAKAFVVFKEGVFIALAGVSTSGVMLTLKCGIQIMLS